MERYEPETLTKDVAYSLVAEHQRRFLITILLSGDDEWRVDELATELAAREHDLSPADVDTATQKRVAVSLLHRHLPRLADAGAVEFDLTTETVTTTPILEELAPLV